MLTEIGLGIKAALDAANLLKLGTEFFRRAGRAPTPDEAAALKAQANSATESAVASIQDDLPVSKLSEPIVRSLRAQLEQISIQLAEAYSARGLTDFQTTIDNEALRRRLCFNLRELRKYSGNTLSSDLALAWAENRCDEFYKSD
jgi:hypothetical protein